MEVKAFFGVFERPPVKSMFSRVNLVQSMAQVARLPTLTLLLVAGVWHGQTPSTCVLHPQSPIPNLSLPLFCFCFCFFVFCFLCFCFFLIYVLLVYPIFFVFFCLKKYLGISTLCFSLTMTPPTILSFQSMVILPFGF